MYLKTLSARGFKSFADKVTLEFEPGISVIVGPNGSGKSNVADAVLWVLGEQSPRNLRGSKMEDVIFAGSATRQPMSMAEVSLSLDNRNRDLPIDFPEVVLTRRIYRTGESEYLLNKTPCRLTDIQELLSDLGVGRELTAVIGQNRLEGILRSQPEDRRHFIEEAAGLRKHRRRKEKALRKIEGVERNLVRIRDIMSEVSKQLKPLERQARQAQEYQELSARIRDLSIRILVAELQELKGQWENRREEEERLARDLEEVASSAGEARRRTGEIEAEIRRLRAELDATRDREMRLVSLGERLRACESLGEERLKLYAALGGDVSYREGWVSRREEMVRRVAELEEERKHAEEELARLREERERLGGERALIAAALGKARQERDACRRALEEARERKRRLEGEASRLRDRGEALRGEAARLRARCEELEAELARLREEESERAREAERLAARREELSAAMQEVRGNIARFREEVDSVGRMQRRSFQEEALVVARLRALQEVFSSRIDYAASASRVLDEAENMPGVVGMLLHHIRIEERWERALESFLGPWLFSVVTRDLHSALQAVRMLKRNEDGYCVFLPLSELARAEDADLGNLARIAGGVPALEVVEGDPEIAPALKHLLGEVVLCSTLDEAAAAAESYPALTFVTQEGDVVAPRRAVKGGARPRSPFHVIARRREIEQLQEMLELCDEEAVSLEVRRKSALSTLESLEKEAESLAAEAGEVQARRRELEQERRILAGRLEEMGSEAAGSLERAASLEEEAEGLELKLGELEKDIAALAGGEEDGARRLRESEEEVSRLREKERECDATLQELKAGTASLQERRSNLEARMEELEAELASPAPPGREELAELARRQERILELARALSDIHGDMAARCGEREARKRGELEARERELEALRERLAELGTREEELRERSHNRDLVAAQLKMRVDMLVQRLLDEYKMPLETAVTDYLPERPVLEMREKCEDLERRRDSLGQVNLMAVEEHHALQERYQFLVEQVEDLRESKASLQKVVRAIDREIMRIFRQTFDEVNRHFQELFEKLFPQGRAELTLSDPTDLLNTGVDIEAQPRGKRLKKLSLLSGGETALISLAFLFALFKTRPSPFYFLDEVEAALDDVNLHRFLDMLKEFRGDSQLIVITHQKRTMEIADVLYGVSMQATGVSRVVSQRLDDAEHLARAGTA